MTAISAWSTPIAIAMAKSLLISFSDRLPPAFRQSAEPHQHHLAAKMMPPIGKPIIFGAPDQCCSVRNGGYQRKLLPKWLISKRTAAQNVNHAPARRPLDGLPPALTGGRRPIPRYRDACHDPFPRLLVSTMNKSNVLGPRQFSARILADLCKPTPAGSTFV